MDVDIRISQALLHSSIVCPAAHCGMHCACVGYVDHELAIFLCRHCQVRYYVGLGPQPVLRAESVAPASEVA